MSSTGMCTNNEDKMTPQYIALKVKEIEEIATDTVNIYRDYDARQKENALYKEIVRYIAMSPCCELAACCKEALKTRDIDFIRFG